LQSQIRQQVLVSKLSITDQDSKLYLKEKFLFSKKNFPQKGDRACLNVSTILQLSVRFIFRHTK